MWIRLCDKLEDYGNYDIPLYEGLVVVNPSRMGNLGIIEQVIYDTYDGAHGEDIWFAAEIYVVLFDGETAYWPVDRSTLVWSTDFDS